jgi:hypothetical protein
MKKTSGKSKVKKSVARVLDPKGTQRPSVRKPSHVPLFAEEHDKLYAAARAVGLPYATWVRATLLVVASWPADQQPIRVRPAIPLSVGQLKISDDEIRRLANVGQKETESVAG